MAVEAARAGHDLVGTALGELVYVLGVHRQGARHHVEIHHARGQGLLEEVGGVGRVHVGDGAAGDGERLLVAGHHVQRHAGTAMVADELAAEVAVEVELGAEARGALDAIDDEVQVAAELARMVAQGAETQVHGIGAGSLELLGERDALVYRGGFAKGLGQVAIQIHERGVVGEVVALLGQVDEHLHGEIVTAGGLDLLDALHHEAGAVLDAAGAVLVVAIVVEAGEELLALIEAGGIDFHGLEAHGLQLGGQGGTGGLDALDGLHGQFRGGHAERRPLEADVGTVGFQLVGQIGEEGNGFFGHRAAVGGHGEGLALHPDHSCAALGEVHVVLAQLVGVAGQVGSAAGGALHHAVLDLEVAELPGREQRGEIGGACAVVVVLGVHKGLVDHVALAAGTGRAGELPVRCGGRRLGRAAGKARPGQSGAERCQARSAQERTTRYGMLGHGFSSSLGGARGHRGQRSHSTMGKRGREEAKILRDATKGFILSEVAARL